MTMNAQPIKRDVMRPVGVAFAFHSIHSQIAALKIQIANSDVTRVNDTDRVVSGPRHKHRTWLLFRPRNRNRALRSAMKLLNRQAVPIFARH